MKSRLRTALAAAACTLLLGTEAATANVVQTFDIGVFTSQDHFPFGTISIDITAGTVTALDVVTPSFAPLFEFTILTGSFGTDSTFGFPPTTAASWVIQAKDSTGNDFLQFFFTTPLITPPNEGSLVGFNGGHVFSSLVEVNCNTTCETSPSLDIVGDLVPTPLPAALPLFATGIGALGLLGWRRKQKAQAAG
jgi:hypothetical protein